VGTLHGLVGSSHLLGILPALALPSPFASWTYIAAFGLGSVAAMTLFAFTIGLLVARFTGRALRAYRCVLAGCGGISIVIGCMWLVSPR
jgi:Na+-transporting NADH:ubiquinone oxidoreductase subunit NqrB